MKTVVLSVVAAKQLYALPPRARDAVDAALNRYAMTGRGDVKALAGEGYRMRVGRYRVLFDEDQTTVVAIFIVKRETTTYKRKR